jgi:hypothetical protein
LQAILLVGMAGTLVELLLLGHFEAIGQIVPLVLLSAGLLLVTAHTIRPRAGLALAVRGCMALFVAAGFIGIGLHLKGNVEFELEMYPSLGGFQLVAQTLTGATPALAPGTMIQLGLVGLLGTYRDPTLQPAEGSSGNRPKS